MKKITYSAEAFEALERIDDKKVSGEILSTIQELSKSKLNGKALVPPLDGYKSVKAWRGKYRILYKEEGASLLIFTVGERLPGSTNDIYQLAGRLVKLIKG